MLRNFLARALLRSYGVPDHCLVSEAEARLADRYSAAWLEWETGRLAARAAVIDAYAREAAARAVDLPPPAPSGGSPAIGAPGPIVASRDVAGAVRAWRSANPVPPPSPRSDPGSAPDYVPEWARPLGPAR